MAVFNSDNLTLCVADALRMIYDGSIEPQADFQQGAAFDGDARVIAVALEGTPRYLIAIQSTEAAGRKLAKAIFDCTEQSASRTQIDDALSELAGLSAGQVKGLLAHDHRVGASSVVPAARLRQQRMRILGATCMHLDGDDSSVTVTMLQTPLATAAAASIGGPATKVAVSGDSLQMPAGSASRAVDTTAVPQAVADLVFVTSKVVPSETLIPIVNDPRTTTVDMVAVSPTAVPQAAADLVFVTSMVVPSETLIPIVNDPRRSAVDRVAVSPTAVVPQAAADLAFVTSTVVPSETLIPIANDPHRSAVDRVAVSPTAVVPQAAADLAFVTSTLVPSESLIPIVNDPHRSAVDRVAVSTARAVPSAEWVRLPENGEGLTVLIAQRDADSIELIRQAAERKKMRLVAVVRDGEQLLNEALRLTPDLLCLDLDLERRDGLKVLAELRKTLPQLKVMMVTAKASKEQVRRAIKLGVTTIVVKPFTVGRLAADLGRVIACEP